MLPPADIADAFSQLRPVHERREVLDAILRCLTPYEWRAVSQTLNLRRFQFDIIGALPVELVASIFAWLPWNYAFTYRRLSKRWCTVLNSPPITRRALSQWAPELVIPPSGDIPRSFKQRVAAFRNGRPFAYANYRINLLLPHLTRFSTCLRTFALHDERVAWVTEARPSDALAILNLRTGESSTFRTPGRQDIKGIAISDKLAVVLTYDAICHVLHLGTWQQKFFRLPSTHITSITTRDWIVAALVPGQGSLLVCYDFHAEKTWSFALQAPLEGQMAAALLLQPQFGSVVVFSASTIGLDQPTVVPDQFTIVSSRYSYAGKSLSASIFVPGRPSQGLHTDVDIGDVHRVDYNGNYHIWPNPLFSDVAAAVSSSDLSSAFSVIYNEQTDTLSSINRDRSTWGISGPFGPSLKIRSYAHWKDAEFSCWNVDHSRVKITGFEGTVSGQIQRRLRTQLQLGSAAESEDDKRRVTPLVNEHYLVVFRKQTLHVWCFDEDTPLPPGSQRVPGGPAKLEYC